MMNLKKKCQNANKLSEDIQPDMHAVLQDARPRINSPIFFELFALVTWGI
jgi:hypothetical protein